MGFIFIYSLSPFTATHVGSLLQESSHTKNQVTKPRISHIWTHIAGGESVESDEQLAMATRTRSCSSVVSHPAHLSGQQGKKGQCTPKKHTWKHFNKEWNTVPISATEQVSICKTSQTRDHFSGPWLRERNTHTSLNRPQRFDSAKNQVGPTSFSHKNK